MTCHSFADSKVGPQTAVDVVIQINKLFCGIIQATVLAVGNIRHSANDMSWKEGRLGDEGMSSWNVAPPPSNQWNGTGITVER